MKGGMVNRSGKRVGANKKQRGRSKSSATLRTYPAAANNNSNFSRCGVVAAYKFRCWTPSDTSPVCKQLFAEHVTQVQRFSSHAIDIQ